MSMMARHFSLTLVIIDDVTALETKLLHLRAARKPHTAVHILEDLSDPGQALFDVRLVKRFHYVGLLLTPRVGVEVLAAHFNPEVSFFSWHRVLHLGFCAVRDLLVLHFLRHLHDWVFDIIFRFRAAIPTVVVVGRFATTTMCNWAFSSLHFNQKTKNQEECRLCQSWEKGNLAIPW